MKSSTETIIAELRFIASDIDADGGSVYVSLNEAAERLEALDNLRLHQEALIKRLKDKMFSLILER